MTLLKTKAAVTRGQGGLFQIEEVELSEPKANEVLIQIIAAGVCHTDAVASQMDQTPFPIVLGHEGSGIVEKVGSEVKHLQPGDHVVLSYTFCGQCENCTSGHPANCFHFLPLNYSGRMSDGTHRIHQSEQEISTFFGQSSFATYAIAHQNNVVKVDKEVDLALLGPLGCGIQTGSGTVFNLLKPSFGSSIAIYGSGTVGLSAIMAAAIAGCKHIIAIDIHENRLELAKELGATHVLNSQQVDIVQEIKQITAGGTHYAVETTGVPEVVKQSLQALRPRGTTAIASVTEEVNIHITNELLLEGKTLTGVIEGNSIPQLFIPQLIDYYKKGLFPFDRLVQFYDFADINQAFQDSLTGVVVKPVLTLRETL